jgi:hypothetical protein
MGVTPPSDPSLAALFGRGSYLVNGVIGCANCHTPQPDKNPLTLAVITPKYMTGGTVFAAGPLAPFVGVVRSQTQNLVGANYGFFKNASFAQFMTTILQGVHGDEVPADGAAPLQLGWPMPWQHMRQMNAGDLEAIYTYLSTVARSAQAPAADVPTQNPARYCAKDGDCLAGETCNVGTDASPGTNECYGRSCTSDAQCDACQTCNGSNVCAVPASDSGCVLQAETL